MPVPRLSSGEARRTAQHGSAAQLSSMASPRFPSTRPVGIVGQSPSILIIDDDQRVRGFLRQALEGAGFMVAEAGTGSEGLNLYRRAPTDLLIVDLLLPDIDGLDVMVELTWDSPDLKILAIAGGSGRFNNLDLAREFGACQILKKPFSMHQLLRTVRGIV